MENIRRDNDTMITDKQLAEFKLLYKKRFKKKLTDQEALHKATKLLRLMEIIYKPITKAELEVVERRREELKDKKL